MIPYSLIFSINEEYIVIHYEDMQYAYGTVLVSRISTKPYFSLFLTPHEDSWLDSKMTDFRPVSWFIYQYKCNQQFAK